MKIVQNVLIYMRYLFSIIFMVFGNLSKTLETIPYSNKMYFCYRLLLLFAIFYSAIILTKKPLWVGVLAGFLLLFPQYILAKMILFMLGRIVYGQPVLLITWLFACYVILFLFKYYQKRKVSN